MIDFIGVKSRYNISLSTRVIYLIFFRIIILLVGRYLPLSSTFMYPKERSEIKENTSLSTSTKINGNQN